MALKKQSKLASLRQSKLIAQGEELSSWLLLHHPGSRMQREGKERELCCHHLSRATVGAGEVCQHQQNPELLLPLKPRWARAVTCPARSPQPQAAQEEMESEAVLPVTCQLHLAGLTLLHFDAP